MKRNYFVVAALIFGSHLQAQTDTASLDEVILTANKFEQKQNQTGKVVTVITKEQLEKSNGKTVVQILNEQAGINIAGTYNTLGSVQSVYMRGASSGRTLITIDGIPVSDPSMINNEFDITLFSLNDIERIEICRGAQSTLYGSDAIAGVINFITIKKEIKNPFNLKLTAGLGNKNTVRNNIQLYGKAGKLTYTTRFGKLSTDGLSSATDQSGSGKFDKDGYDGNVINTAVQYQIIPSLQFRTFIQHSQYKAAIDAGIFTDDKDYTINNSNLAAGGGIIFKKGNLGITYNYHYGNLKRKYLNDSLHAPGFTKFERNEYDGRTNYHELYGNIKATKWLTILAGFDYRKGAMNQQYISLNGFGPFSFEFKNKYLHQHSFYSSLLFNTLKSNLTVEMGLRFNKHSRYGSNATYTFNPSYSLSEHWRIFGSIAIAFKAPSVFQVFDQYSGNEDLKAEKSTNYEIGIQQKHAVISSRIVYFNRKIINGMDYNYVTYKYFNFVKQKVNGLEVEVTATPVKKLSMVINYTLLTGDEQTQSRKSFNDTSYTHLLRRPKHTMNFTLGYQFMNRLYVSLSGKSVSSRYDVGGYMQEDFLLDNYFILNAYAEYQYRSNLKFFLDAQNLANKKFVDIRGYNAIPLMISGGISFNL